MSGNRTLDSESSLEQSNSSVSLTQNFLPIIDNIPTASSLPSLATYNLRSLAPKIESLKTDILERKVDVAFLQEIWEKTTDEENPHSISEAEKMFELNGLLYFSSPRILDSRGRAYGGTAIIVNSIHFEGEKLPLTVPKGVEATWGLLKPKNQPSKFKQFIICSFYSPPGKGKNSKLSDHITSTLHMLYTKYPDSAIILGGDCNDMDLSPLINCGLKLRQTVDQKTHGNRIIDVLIMNIASCYSNPIIAPPIQPDNPRKGVASDHCVPVCFPHLNRYDRPERNRKMIKYRPLPESGKMMFGEWIVKASWSDIQDCSLSPSQKAQMLDTILTEKLDLYCPVKVKRLSSHDKPFITPEIKNIDRRRNREYAKRGKTLKYFELKKTFELKYRAAAKRYLKKSLESLDTLKMGQAFRVLKNLGAQPGESTDNCSFVLQSHMEANLTAEQSAEKIAAHFSAISQEFPPLNVVLLPDRVKDKLKCPGAAPVLSEYQVYRKILQANKPKSGTPNDLPKEIIQEFSPEFATPLTVIFNNMFSTGEWPDHWKLEYVTPIGKVPKPKSENDLRPISLTPFFSKVAEHFVVDWILEFVSDKIDLSQYGGLKGHSTTHYIIEFLDFILNQQDSSAQIAVIACYIDFQKAFNRQDHNLLIQKLSDLNVPGWLLSIVTGFLSNRRMIVRYNGSQSSVKSLPGGGPQGTILALLLFIILINDIGCKNCTNSNCLKELHLKFVDDLTIAESVNLQTDLELVNIEDRTLPANYHQRTGHFLPNENSKIAAQLQDIKTYADENSMKINYGKTQLMTFNPCWSIDFQPEIQIEDHELELVSEKQLLGLIIRSDLKWTANTMNMIRKAYKRLWILRRLKILGAKKDALLQVYTKQIRCVLELSVPAWQGSLTEAEKTDLERIQKCAAHIILGMNYKSYSDALDTLNLESLEARRVKLCLKFALRAEKHPKFSKWFTRSTKTRVTRSIPNKYFETRMRHERLKKGPISYLTSLLNQHYSKK